MNDRHDDSGSVLHALDHDSDNRSKKGQKDKDADSSSKLSHVPCKFYRVGACTAGNNCPFSHSAIDRGGPKETCQWFIKGNCKFGHKCALAHILPGQPMAMDKKNKKAAQLSNQAAGAHDGSKDGKNKRGRGAASGAANGHQRNDSRAERGSKPASNLTATAPMIPSPAQDDPSVEAGHSPPQTLAKAGTNEQEHLNETISQQPSAARPAMPTRFSSGRNTSTDMGYGPIGSPPNASAMRAPFVSTNNNAHYAPGTSPPPNPPNVIHPSTSPFAHGEGKQHFFGAYNRMQGDRGEQSPIAIQRAGWRTQVPERNENAVASDDDDLEEFLPSSLNDLLTPEERQRRLSRSGGTRAGLGYIGENSVGNVGLGGVGSMSAMGMGNHRYSRSVPAARLLEAASVWKETDRERERDNALLSAASLSFRSTGLGSEGFSPSHAQLGISNASGAFLHGFSRTTMANPVPGLTRHVVSQSYEEADVLGAVPTPATIAARGGNRYESYNLQTNTRHAQLGADALSPSARALQSHAPGQSLPQGLAAGLSRLHLGANPLGGQQIGAKQPIPGMSMGMGMGYGVGDIAPKSNVRSPLRSQFTSASPDPRSINSAVDSIGTNPIISASPGGLHLGRPSWAQHLQHQSSPGNMAQPVPTPVPTAVPAGTKTGNDAEEGVFALDD